MKFGRWIPSFRLPSSASIRYLWRSHRKKIISILLATVVLAVVFRLLFTPERVLEKHGIVFPAKSVQFRSVGGYKMIVLGNDDVETELDIVVTDYDDETEYMFKKEGQLLSLVQKVPRYTRADFEELMTDALVDENYVKSRNDVNFDKTEGKYTLTLTLDADTTYTYDITETEKEDRIEFFFSITVAGKTTEFTRDIPLSTREDVEAHVKEYVMGLT